MYELLQMNIAMETIIDSLSPEFNHPLVIALGNRGNINQLFIAVEKQVIAVQHGLANAVCRLMQLYYMLDMEYAEPAKHILHFLQRAVMTVDDQLPLCRSGSDLSLYIKKRLGELTEADQNGHTTHLVVPCVWQIFDSLNFACFAQVIHKNYGFLKCI
jgi:hypothetical protein